MKVLVIGTEGSLGGVILRRAIERFGEDNVIAGHYDDGESISREFTNIKLSSVDITNQKSLRAALEGMQLVLSAAPQKEPLLQQVAADLGVNTVDVGAHYSVAKTAIESINSPKSFQLVCAGQAPGVTGLMAKKLYEKTKQPVNVGFLLANNGRSGSAGVRDMLRIIDTSPNDPIKFDYHTIGVRRSVPAETNELKITNSDAQMESMVAFEGNLMNETILALRKIGLLKLLYTNEWLLKKIAKPNSDMSDEVIYISAVSEDQRINLRSKSDYMAAAYSAVALAEIATQKQVKGVKIPAEAGISLEEVVEKSDGVMRIV